jgi:hypothetical protein
MIRISKVVLVPALVATTLLSACGGDSGSSSDDEAFCQEIEQLENLDIETDIAAAAEILAELADKAPNNEVRDALRVIAPIFEQLSSVDQNDETAMMEVLESMSSPEVTEASEVLDRYGSDVCGFDDSDNSTSTDAMP